MTAFNAAIWLYGEQDVETGIIDVLMSKLSILLFQGNLKENLHYD